MYNRMLLGIVLVAAVVAAGCSEADRGQSREGQEASAVAAGDATAGQAVYDANCGSCHRLGDYDKDGSINLARHRQDISADFVADHHGEGLSAADVANLKAFVAAQ